MRECGHQEDGQLYCTVCGARSTRAAGGPLSLDKAPPPPISFAKRGVTAGQPVSFSKPTDGRVLGGPGRGTGPAAAPPEPPRSRGPLLLLVAGVALLAVAVAGVTLAGGEDDPVGTTALSPVGAGASSATPSVAPPTSSAPATVPSTTPPSSVPSPTPSPTPSSGPAYWTVITASTEEDKGGEDQADEYAADLQAYGHDARVFWSGDHSSLNDGYWVTASGRFRSRAAASELALELKAEGFPIAYPRCVGDATDCP